MSHIDNSMSQNMCAFRNTVWNLYPNYSPPSGAEVMAKAVF